MRSSQRKGKHVMAQDMSKNSDVSNPPRTSPAGANRTTQSAADAQPVQRKDDGFPLAGEQYVPLVDKTEDGRVYSHALQTINADADALYAFWKDVDSFPLWMERVVSCTPVDDNVTHWVMGNPEDEKGARVEFDSKIVEDEPGRKLAWESTTSGIDQSGSVTFTPHPAGRGTIVQLRQVVRVPAGAIGNAAVSVAERGPRQIVIEDLRHFKEMAEAGSIPSVKGQPHGPRGFSGSVKEWMYGETNPTPPGASKSA